MAALAIAAGGLMRKAGAVRDVPPPLELVCLRALWELKEGNVRDVQRAVSADRSLAYTTVMTLLERLVRKGAASRRKVGRAFVYSPQKSRDTLRRIALEEFLESFFEGSADQLIQFIRSLDAQPAAAQPEPRLDTALL